MLSRSLQKIYTLPPRAWLILVEMVGISLLVEVGLRVLPFNRLMGFIQKHPTRQLRKEPNEIKSRLAEIRRLAEAVFRHYPLNLTCLKKALVLKSLLGRQGMVTDLKIGLKKEGDLLKAHAWLEQDGEIITDAPGMAEEFQSVISLRNLT